MKLYLKIPTPFIRAPSIRQLRKIKPKKGDTAYYPIIFKTEFLNYIKTFHLYEKTTKKGYQKISMLFCKSLQKSENRSNKTENIQLRLFEL